MAKYRLLRSRHQEGKHKSGELKGKPITYEQGDVFFSNSDLLKMNSPGSKKFEKLSDESAPSDPEDDEEPDEVFTEGEAVTASTSTDSLDGMTVGELRAHAEREEIDLGNAKRKTDIIAVIVQATQ